MKSNKKASSIVLSAVALLIQAALPKQVLAEDSHASVPQWSVQVEKVDAGDVTLEPAFRVAIYENLLSELSKAKNFKQVFRSGDRKAGGLGNVLVLKITVQSYTPGSETKRAVTTVGGATKLKVLSQLRTPDGQVVLEQSVAGNVRFFGGNLRATHNLARNVVAAIQRTTLPPALSSALQRSVEDVAP